MLIDSEKLKGQQTITVLQSAMADLTQHIEEIEEAIDLATDPDYDAEERQDAREQIGTALEELFAEFEALWRICAERLT